MKIRVQYYAVFRERRGIGEEVLDTHATTAGDLYAQLAGQYGFNLPPEIVRASINLQFKPLESELSEGDVVVFIPPVAGG